MPAEAGIKFGSFILLRRIARGGMAEVFLAQQRGLEGFDRRVAVKRILPHLADSQDFVRMFLGEAKLAAQLSHPNIVHIYEFGKVAGDFFIAMEYVEGVHAGDLFQASGATDRLSPTLVARIGADAAAALHSAHELRGSNGKPLGLVHRDVSPANIMISYDGVVKLCDFGIAKAAAATDQLTSPGQVKGKYAYMSPEQTVAQPLDGRSDVFSLSIVLWELLAGKFAVPRGDAVAAMRMIRDGKIEPLSAVAPHVPPALSKAIAWGLETKRDNRATASELAQALEAFVKQSPEIATPMQLGSWVRTHFVREQTGEHPSLVPASPGTVVSPHTDASSDAASFTPDPDRSLIASSRFTDNTDSGAGTREVLLDEAFETHEIRKPPRSVFEATTSKPFIAPVVPPAIRNPAPTSTMTVANEIFDLSDGETTIDKPFTPLGPVSGLTPAPENGADAPTQIATRMRGMPDQDDDDDDDHSDSNETVMISRGDMMPMSPGPSPGPSVLQTEFVSPLSGPRVRVSEPLPPSGAMQSLAPVRPFSGFLTPWRARTPPPPDAQSNQMRIAIAVAALVGLALISFVIALAASGHHSKIGPAPPKDAAAAVVMVEVDAGVAVVADAPAVVIAPPDARREAVLEVVTFPEGASIKVGDQRATAPAQITVAPGTFEVLGELVGYQSETRPVTIAAGQHFKIELTFNHKLATPSHATTRTGLVSVRTMPNSDVYENGKKIGETPITDREMPVGSHTFVFKNPIHPPITRTFVISTGKPTKLSYKLPD